MKTTKVIGDCAVSLVDDGMGVRVVVGNPERSRYGGPGYVENPTIVARTRSDLRAVITELRTLVDQLPEQAS